MREGDKMNEAEREILPLLSGWLDGELTPEENQRVEKALERSATLRAIVDEWRSVEQTIHAQETVRSDAEWEALALRVEGAIAEEPGSAASSHQQAVGRGTRELSTSWLERIQAWFAPRRWAVGGTGALAAVVLLVILWPRSEELLNTPGVLKNVPTPEVEQPTARQREVVQLGKEESQASDTVKEPAVGASDEVAASSGELGLPPALDEKKSEADARRDTPTTPPALASAPPAPEADRVVPEAEAPAAGPSRLQREGRTSEAMVQIDRAEEVLLDSGTRKKDANQAAPTAKLLVPPEPVPPASRERSVARQFLALQSHDGWLAQTNRRLHAALETKDHDDLQQIVADIDRHRVETPADASNVAFLELAIRGRGEYMRLFPDASGNDNACDTIRADYATFQKLADQTTQESLEGLQIRDLVGEVCPE